MSLKLFHLGRACFRGGKRVLAAWLLLLALVIVGLGVFGSALDSQFTIPGTSAQVALDDLETTFPQTAGGSAQIVVQTDQGSVTDPAVHSAVEQDLADIAGMPGVVSVSDPYTGARITPSGNPSAPAQAPPSVVQPTHVSADGTTLYAPVQFSQSADSVPDSLKDDVEHAMSDTEAQPATSVYFGGQVFQERGLSLSIVDVIGIFVALIVLAITFRSFVTAVFPIGTALIGVVVALGGLLVASNVISVSSSAPSLSLMIGLAVGIDYALFIVSRYRELLREGHPLDEAAARAIATAGSAVVFAGTTVVIALCGLSIAGIPFLTVMGIGAAAAVVVAVLIALTALPALFGLAGDRLRPKAVPTPASNDVEAADGTISSRWARFVTRRRWWLTAGVAGFLLLCAIPAASLRLALPDNGNQAAGTSQRIAYDTISDEFGPGYNGPLTITADVSSSTDPAQTVNTLATELSQVNGVQAVTGAAVSGDGSTAVFSVVPKWSADDTHTSDLVNTLRDEADTRPDWADVDLAVTGQTAVNIDTSSQLASALVPFGAVVVGLSLLLLLLVFRSLWVPLTASLGYLLSTAASFGAVSLVFEHGFLAGFFGVDPTGPVVSFLPIMLMGVLFGLAMDYQVFLVSRMREHYVHAKKARASVTAGIRRSSRVVVAAAIIMISVFAAFVPTGDAIIKPIAFSLAIGVALDAFLVRLTLIPAVMTILGDRAWHLPRWLDRLLPNLDIEGESLDESLRAERGEAGATPASTGEPAAESAPAADHETSRDRDTVPR